MDVDSRCRGLGVVRAANDVKPQVAFSCRLVALDGNEGINLVGRNADNSLMPEF